MKARTVGHGKLSDEKLASLAYHSTGGESFSALQSNEFGVSLNDNLEICHNVVLRIAHFLPEDEGNILRERLDKLKTNDQIALLALRTAQNKELTEMALNAPAEAWGKKYPNSNPEELKTTLRAEIDHVLALVKITTPKEGSQETTE